MSDEEDSFGIFGRRNVALARVIFRAENPSFNDEEYFIPHLDIIEDARNVLDGERLARGELWWDCTVPVVRAAMEERLADAVSWRVRQEAALPHHIEAMRQARRLLNAIAVREARPRRRSKPSANAADFWDTAGI